VSFFYRIRASNSAKTASKRLKSLVMHDRAGISPGELDALREELISVISRHVAIEAQQVRLELSIAHDQHRLIADIPLASERKRRR
jgi:cell division topological specificity factor